MRTLRFDVAGAAGGERRRAATAAPQGRGPQARVIPPSPPINQSAPSGGFFYIAFARRKPRVKAQAQNGAGASALWRPAYDPVRVLRP